MMATIPPVSDALFRMFDSQTWPWKAGQAFFNAMHKESSGRTEGAVPVK